MNDKTDFVIHEHKAKKAGLHYDLRIKIGDTLKDWVFRKIPPTEIGVKRLGFEQPEHNTIWLDFEGIIEEGYGAGELKIWDRGKVDIKIENNDKIICNFQGKKMLGQYILLNNTKLKGWLFWKSE